MNSSVMGMLTQILSVGSGVLTQLPPMQLKYVLRLIETMDAASESPYLATVRTILYLTTDGLANLPALSQTGVCMLTLVLLVSSTIVASTIVALIVPGNARQTMSEVAEEIERGAASAVSSTISNLAAE